MDLQPHPVTRGMRKPVRQPRPLKHASRSLIDRVAVSAPPAPPPRPPPAPPAPHHTPRAPPPPSRARCPMCTVRVISRAVPLQHHAKIQRHKPPPRQLCLRRPPVRQRTPFPARHDRLEAHPLRPGSRAIYSSAIATSISVAPGTICSSTPSNSRHPSAAAARIVSCSTSSFTSRSPATVPAHRHKPALLQALRQRKPGPHCLQPRHRRLYAVEAALRHPGLQRKRTRRSRRGFRSAITTFAPSTSAAACAV